MFGLGRESYPRDDLAAPCRQLVEDGDIEITVKGECQGPRNRRRGHDEDVGRVPLPDERLALGDAEFMLFVDHGETEPVFESGASVDEGMGPDRESARPFSASRCGGKKRHLTGLVPRPRE